MPKRGATLRITKGGKRRRKHRSRRRLRRRGGGVRRGQRGGACGCPKVIDPSPLPVPPYLPPGGMYNPGGINGLTGGYYYGVNTSHALPDPVSFTNLGGGYRKKRRRRKRKRRTRRRRRRRRRTHKKRRRQKGGGVTSLLNALLPTDIMDLGYKAGHSLGNLYTGYRGEKPFSSPNVIKQPIDKNYKIVGTKPINIPLAYNKGQSIVNSTITPTAQRQYK